MCPEVLTPSQPIQVFYPIFSGGSVWLVFSAKLKEDLRAFGMLLGRVLPLQVESHSEERAEATYRTIEEVRHELSEARH